MAKKSRKQLKSTPTLFAWPRVILIIIPVLAAILIMFNTSNGRNVLGVSDENLLNINKGNKEKNEPSKTRCKSNRVAAFSVTTLCDSNKNGFKQINYTCADGITGSLNKGCTNIQSAYEKALKACSRTSECAKLDQNKKLSPKPTSVEPTKSPTGL